MNELKISERNQGILKALISRYIREGLPVASKSLVQEMGLSVSSATMRNIMADLESQGLVSAPHTSAGRVPTEQGYRMFVDSLITVDPVDPNYLASLKEELDPKKSSTELVDVASNFLSQLTSQAGIVTTPRMDSYRLQQVEFVPLSGNRVLVVLVINDQDVENRIIHTERAFSHKELKQAARYINERFAGQELPSICDALVEAMRHDKNTIDDLMQLMIDVAADSSVGEEGAVDYVVAGQNNLMENTELSSVRQLKELFDAFQAKKDILQLMNYCLDADGVRIFIGHESGYQLFEDYSLITAPYGVGGGLGSGKAAQAIGVLGIIGPTRMAYDRVIPVVDITAKMLSAALTQ